MEQYNKVNLGLHNLQPEHHGDPIEKLSNNKEFEVSFHLKSDLEDGDWESEDAHRLFELPYHERDYLSYSNIKKELTAKTEIVTELVKFAKEQGLKLVESSAADRVVSVKGDIDSFKKALGCEFDHFEDVVSKEEYSVAYGEISLPENILQNLTAITGIHPGLNKAGRDNNLERHQNSNASPEATDPDKEKFLGYTPKEIESAYNFPKGNGKGQTIGLIELGGTYKQSDLDTYFKKFKIKSPSIKIMGDMPGESAMDDFEVTLDIELAASLAPAASFIIYYGKSLIDAVKLALSDTKNKPDILSISWAGSEFNYSAQELVELNQLIFQAGTMGVTVVVASGDQGAFNSKSYLNVNVPAASPYALGCGGTTLFTNGYEAVWNELDKKLGATGGGFSYKYSIPAYQKESVLEYNQRSSTPGYSSDGRAVPDVSANADSLTGYQIILNGVTFPGGGTSAATPVWAALIARINQQLGSNVGYLNKALYQMRSNGALKAVSGNKEETALGNNGHYLASDTWNPCTGLGAPNGELLLEAIQSISAS